MTRLLLIGDIHGKYQSYREIIKATDADRSIQIGDFGWGFPGDETEFMQRAIKPMVAEMEAGNHRFFRGNHDNTIKCRELDICLPDVHYEEDTDIFTIAGANSIDKEWRTEGFDWWPDEEMSMDELYAAIDLYEKVKPSVVISHEAPEDIVPYMFQWYRQEYPSRTRQALASMLSIHKPSLWVFGHWHSSKRYETEDTQFVCLTELETMVIDV